MSPSSSRPHPTPLAPSPTSPSPAPSSSASSFSSSSSSSSSNPPFRFPFGPSSRYHQREKARPALHSRGKSAAYVPTAPVLSTERRAHRRAHTAKSSGSICTTASGVSTSPASEYSRSPLSRFASYPSSSASHAMAAPSASALPTTPAKSIARRSSSLQHSPFSDYFTDDARSTDSSTPATETKHLLVRMNRLQSQLMRDHPDSCREAMHIVGRKLGEMEAELDALHSQTRIPLDAEVDDSGVFMDEDESEKKGEAPAGGQPVQLQGPDGPLEIPPQPATLEQYKTERDWFIFRMQELLNDLGTAQTQLGKRYAEVRELNNYHNAQIEERDTQLEQLKLENEGLRSDLGFEYSELLFLKLQMKSLEVDIDALSDDTDQPDTAATKARGEKKNRILSEMDRWRTDWQDVKSRYKRRRNRYGVQLDSQDSDSDASPAGDSNEADWHLETVKDEGRGRITSLTIKRMDSNYGTLFDKQSSDDVFTTNATASSRGGLRDGDAQHRNPQGSGEPQIAPSTKTPPPSLISSMYAESGTQTDLSQLPSQADDFVEDTHSIPSNNEDFFPLQQTQPHNALHPGPSGADLEQEQDEDDYAITSSSEADAGDTAPEENEPAEPDVSGTLRPKTAWQELWTSLAHLSGLGEEEDEE